MTKYRDMFYEEIKKGLIGPGSDVFGVEETEELISDYPLNRYYSGILFPEKTFSSNSNIPNSEEEKENSENIANTNEEDYDTTITTEENDIKEEVEAKEEPKKEDNSQTSDGQDFQLNQNTFFPTHIGFTFCLESNVNSFNVNFSFGIYEQLELPSPKTKVAIFKEAFETFFDPAIETQLLFKDTIMFENGFMFLNKKLNGSAKSPRSGDYKNFDEFKRKENIGKKEAYKYVHLLEKLLGRVWKREEVSINKEIPIENTNKKIEIFKKIFSGQTLSVSYVLKNYEYKGSNYVKILLLNTSQHPSPKFSNTNENLNKKCLFQSAISIENVVLKPYKSQAELHPFDEEQNEINFIYRDVKNYGVGHNCSVEWYNKQNGNSDNPNSIRITFMPELIVKGIKNDFSKEDFIDDFDNLNKCLEIKQLSHFNNDKKTIIDNLKLFASLYQKWISSEEGNLKDFNQDDKTIAGKLIGRQKVNLRRLQRGIEIISTNEEAFRCFQLANTAMFIQMIISKDVRFGNKERYLIDGIEKVDYDSLDFFEQYSGWKYLAPDKPESPRYRPFQLAFLLLSIEGITDINSDDRNKVVDLIWFPTGGGKTEAYLSVAAFTILWRRLSNDEEIAKGTSIIIRYTLRLLTSQQFERASRLILALEFLRRKFEDELHEEKISIGLWVGEGVSPNKIKDADEIIQKATSDPEKAEQFTSRLQLTSCPWCGTRLISKTQNGSWISGYESQGGTKGYFYFNCVNEKCIFHSNKPKLKLPIQVVDEMLYKEPPTLLFATVDKFAQLAWKEDTNKFFNAFSESLPPDLIIQDELHLISGPLGSIVGIFESVVDFLCSKGNRKPKIIASTATTRNTSQQVKELYWGKEVNIFPPSGISHKDSFFVRETVSKRKYVGFMPTGKTGINTQLWILPFLLYTRLKLYDENNLKPIDLYWTIVSYYNALKALGKIYNKTNDEIQINTNVLFYRNFGNNLETRFLIKNIDERSEELTSRIESNNIKAKLKQLEDNFKTDTSEKGNEYVKNVLDLVLASNMISVGIDISRLNVMLINGMPRNIAEYIQASSRVGRKHDGIVFTLFNPNQARDKSYFENFNSFHKVYYKFIEPLSVTPFTESTIRKMLTTIFIAFLRNSVPSLTLNADAKNFIPEHAEQFKKYIRQRFGNNQYFDDLLDDLIKSWDAKNRRENNNLTYEKLLKKTSTNIDPLDEIWLTMNSLRDIDTETYYRINDLAAN